MLYVCISIGKIYTWGNGSYYKLGHNDNTNKVIPTPIIALEMFSNDHQLNIGQLII